jgi:hypothetical protein
MKHQLDILKKIIYFKSKYLLNDYKKKHQIRRDVMYDMIYDIY